MSGERTRPGVVLAALAGLLLMQAPAVAQPQAAKVVGTIEASVDGHPRSWYQIELGAGESATPMSFWTRVSAGVFDVTLQGFREPRFVLEDALAISLSLTGGLPSDCPCRYDGSSASVLYLVGGSMTDRMYVSYEGGQVSVVIDVFYPVGEEAYHVEGSFEASLPFVPDPSEGADFGDVVDIAGTFAIERLQQDAYP